MKKNKLFLGCTAGNKVRQAGNQVQEAGLAGGLCPSSSFSSSSWSSIFAWFFEDEDENEHEDEWLFCQLLVGASARLHQQPAKAVKKPKLPQKIAKNTKMKESFLCVLCDLLWQFRLSDFEFFTPSQGLLKPLHSRLRAHFSVLTNRNFLGGFWQGSGRDLTAGPADPDFRGRFWSGKHLD